MWTKENRGRYDRSRLRYPSDLTDEEWALVEPLIAPAKRGGNKRTVDVREVVNGWMYLLSPGCQWRAIPKDLPPRSTVHDYFDLWAWEGTLDRIHHAIYVQCRELASREPSPSAVAYYAVPTNSRALSAFRHYVTDLWRRTPRRDRPQMKVKPRNAKVSGFPSPRSLRSFAAKRPNSIKRVLSGWSDSANSPSLSRIASRKRRASPSCSKPTTESSAYRTTIMSPQASCRLQRSAQRSKQ